MPHIDEIPILQYAESPKSSRAMRRAAQRNNILIYACFLFPLLFLALLFPAWPDETISSDEQRTLQQRPALVWENVIKGEYSSAMDSYYSDQFPWREELIAANRTVEQFMSSFPHRHEQQIQLITAVKDEGGEGAIENPEAAVTIPEPRGPVANREITETAAKLVTPDESDLNYSNIVIINGHAMEIHYYSPQYTAEYAERINHLSSILPDDTRLISMIVPTAVAYYGTEELRSGPYSNFSAIKNIYEHEAPEIFKVDAYTELAQHVDEYIYFRTDHHWTGRGAYYAYKAFCATLELEATELEDMTLTMPESTFLGSLYNYTNKSSLLENSADRAEIFLPRHQAFYNYYLDETMEDPISGTLLAANVPQDNHYLLYLGGDVPIGHIASELQNGRSILVVKDSFGNAFIPYLIDNYEDIYLIDPRQYEGALLDFIVQWQIDDVLVMNYTFAVSNSNWLDGFDYITGYTEPKPSSTAE